MNVPNIANQGSVGQERDRANARVGHEKTVVLSRPGRDRATISASGRDTLAAIEGLAERARHLSGERREIVAAAAARLHSGDLASDQVIAETAGRIAEAGFLAG